MKVTLSLQGVREVLGLCAVPGRSWEAMVSPCPSPLLPIPCTDQIISPTSGFKEGVCLGCHSSETFIVMHEYGHAWELVASALCLAG